MFQKHQTIFQEEGYLEKLEHIFVTEGGIKERMYAARTGYRQEQDAYIANLENENKELKEENAILKKKIIEIIIWLIVIKSYIRS